MVGSLVDFFRAPRALVLSGAIRSHPNSPNVVVSGHLRRFTGILQHRATTLVTVKGTIMDNEDQTTEVSGAASDKIATPLETRIEDPMVAYAQAVSEQHDGRRRTRRRRITMAAGLALVLAVSLVVIGVSGPGSTDAAAQVELGARTTLAAQTAALTISGSITANGESIPVTGSGYANLSTDLEDVTLSFSDAGTALNETELTDGTNLYMQISENGQNVISQLLPGKDWLSLPLTTNSSELGSGAPNILTQLQVLTQQGNTVVPLGSSTINGVNVTGYQVTFSQSAMSAAANRVKGLTGAESQAVQAVVKDFTKNPPVLKVWLDANHLLQREEVSISMSASGGAVAADVIIDFSDYGTPITVSVPAASDVGSYSDFLTAAQSAQNAS